MVAVVVVVGVRSTCPLPMHMGVRTQTGAEHLNLCQRVSAHKRERKQQGDNLGQQPAHSDNRLPHAV
jgi:hypothetical protein